MSHTPLSILQANPHASYLAHQREIDEAIHRVLDSGWYILGKEVSAFEKEFAAFIGVPHAIGVANGTDALELALRACEIGAGDEVITVSHTAVATVAAIELVGATPVFVDIETGSYLMDPRQIEAAIVPAHEGDFAGPSIWPAGKPACHCGNCPQAFVASYRGLRPVARGFSEWNEDRCLGRCGCLQFLSHQESGRFRRWRDGGDGRSWFGRPDSSG